MRINKEATNRRVFDEFIQLTRLPIKEETIESEKPGWPDILCEHENGEKVTYEITEIVDEKLMRRTRRQSQFGKLLRDSYSNLDPDLKALIKRRYSNAKFFLDILDQATNNQIESAIPSLFKFLSEFDDDSPGNIDITKNDLGSLAKYFDDILIFRMANRQGPVFNVSHADCLHPPVAETLGKKIGKKTYKTDGIPIELICYTEHVLMDIATTHEWLHPVLESFQSIAPFRRIWGIDLTGHRSPYSYPDGVL